MDFTQSRTVKTVAILLLLAAISQPIYTLLYIQAPEIDRKFLWGLEGLLFVLLAAFAGSALVMAKRYTLGFSAIAFSAVLNVVQVGVGLTQFGPFREAATADPALGVLMGAVAAFSFFCYNSAKILLGLAALVFGMGKMGQGSKALGGLTALAGTVAFLANTLVMMFGRADLPQSITGGAGASGVAATLLLALCLFSLKSDD